MTAKALEVLAEKVFSLITGMRKGLIPSVKTALDAMIANGRGIQEEMYRRMLSEAGETAEA